MNFLLWVSSGTGIGGSHCRVYLIGYIIWRVVSIHCVLIVQVGVIETSDL